ncbi:response regulator [Deinococcus aetherius]|uniref:Response regulator n=1 Tax=Deinococcus aetherius TaxID=200252 RepID=A0ABM8ACD0_9DEIO|nr:response regulator [Deinococcus aetherius]
MLFIRRAFGGTDLDVTLRVARDGEQALEELAAPRPPDLVLLDLRLPRLGGLEVLAWLRAQAHLARVPVVVLTTSHEPRDVRGAYDVGATSYLVKPVNAEALRTLVQTLGLYWLRLNTPAPDG